MMENYLAINKEILSFATTEMNTEDNILSEISQREEDKDYISSLIYGT